MGGHSSAFVLMQHAYEHVYAHANMPVYMSTYMKPCLFMDLSRAMSLHISVHIPTRTMHSISDLEQCMCIQECNAFTAHTGKNKTCNCHVKVLKMKSVL